MLDVIVRKRFVTVEEIFHDGGPIAAQPALRGVVGAVIHNPFAGRYVEEITDFMEDLKPLGKQMALDLIDALGGDPARIEGYGKASMVGEGGELEHGALWHAPGGYSMRETLPASNAIVPSGGPGTRIDVPVTHSNASYVRSHFDSIEVGLNDAPKADEMLVILVMTTGPRIHNRAGGLAAADVTGKDGLR
ncbi:MAG: amino acid synthesis family protein [Pseudomonadota bacterium]